MTGVRPAAPAHDGQGRQAGGELPVTLSVVFGTLLASAT